MNAAFLKNFTKEFSFNDLPNEDVKYLAEEIGVENVVKFILNFAGMNFYIQKNMVNHLMKIYVKKHYDGKNLRKLALSLGVTERTIYKWLNRKKQH